MATLHRSTTSEEDCREIWRFIAQDNIDAADALLRHIYAKLELYAQQPRMGTVRDDLAPGLRSFPFGNYLVVYRIVPDGIELVRVVHAKRNLKSLFMHEGRRDGPEIH
jgi:toxin ParE1/3/4